MTEREILALLASGRVAFRHPLKLHYREGSGLFGVSVPKRLFKRAVMRNLLKRRVREAWRHNCPRLGDKKFDVFIYYIGKEAEDYGQIEKSLCQILDDLASD